MRIYRIAQSQDSSGTEWRHDASEVFDFFLRRFNVTRAKKLVHEKPRPVLNFDLSEIKGFIPKRPAKDRVSMGIRVNWSKIDSGSVDLSVPIIVASLKDGQYLPIDGWHRMAKALDMGRSTLPAVVLTEEETNQVML